MFVSHCVEILLTRTVVIEVIFRHASAHVYIWFFLDVKVDALAPNCNVNGIFIILMSALANKGKVVGVMSSCHRVQG